MTLVLVLAAWSGWSLAGALILGRYLKNRDSDNHPYRSSRRMCSHCMYVGPQILCGCSAEMRARMEAGDVRGALSILDRLQQTANYDLKKRREQNG